DGERIATRVLTDVVALNDGRIGVANANAETRFDNFRAGYLVNEGRTMEPIDDQFGYDQFGAPVMPSYFTPNNPALWQPLDLNGNVVLEANTTNTLPGDRLATLLVKPEGTVPSNFRVETVINTTFSAGSWSDGFIIFDYKNENDFKYAGMFSGQNQWVVGHYLGYFNNRISNVDWDNEGRDIVNTKNYHLAINVVGEQVFFYVDDELISTSQFNGEFLLNDGAIGLANFNARTRFHSFAARPYQPVAPAPAPVYDEVFAASNLFFLEDEEEEKIDIASGRNKVIN
ncbi:MAG: hypothetical protein CMJ46_09155, partial [Planctomyces sp.]|nr:hypothetical protein [Planctomyces sp.]